MHDGPAVFVRVEDAGGAHGWGEAWCNFPSCGAEHRARLVETVMTPLLLGRRIQAERESTRSFASTAPICRVVLFTDDRGRGPTVGFGR
jgi:D-galactarolactone cycloisomerase